MSYDHDVQDNNTKTSKPNCKPVMVYGVDPQAWRSARALAYERGLKMGSVVADALRLWLEKERKAA